MKIRTSYKTDSHVKKFTQVHRILLRMVNANSVHRDMHLRKHSHKIRGYGKVLRWGN